MLIEGKRDADLLKIAELKITDLETQQGYFKTKEYVNSLQVKQLTDKNKDLIDLNDKLFKKADRRKKFAILTTSIAVVLGVLIVLK